MIKTGDILKNIKSGKTFTVKSADHSIILLTSKDGFHSMFVQPDNIESEFVPLTEEEVIEKTREK